METMNTTMDSPSFSDSTSILFGDSLKEQIAKNIALDIGKKWRNYCCERRANKHKSDSYRKGPAPVDEYDQKKSINQATYGTLDSDVEDLEFEEDRKNGTVDKSVKHYNKVKSKTNNKGDSLASCRALIVYFSKLAKSKDEHDTIDLDFVDNLLQGGADINFPDRYGQTILHEIARGWHPDVAKFALEHQADVNKCDSYGRTPLHLAAAVDYEQMVEYLVQNGGRFSGLYQYRSATIYIYSSTIH